MLLFMLTSTTAVWAQFGGGSGTESSPYLISTTAHMEQLAADVNDGNKYEGTYFKMTQDIDYAGGSHTPIGCDTGSAWHNFCGHFDGDGHSILNVKIDGNKEVALFGRAFYGSIKNLTLGGNSLVTGKNGVAGIVGQGFALSIINCHVAKDVTIRANGFQTSVAVGGIVGCLDGGSSRVNVYYIRNCTNAATVEFKGTYGAQYMGGIIGYTRNTMGTTIQNCYNVGAVNPVGVGGTEANCQYIGGIVGWIEDGDGIWFKDNYCGGNCTRRAVGQKGTINATDISGQADRMNRIRTISKITADISTAPTISIDGSDYYGNGTKVDMTLTYNVALQEGEIMRYAADQGTLTPNGTGYTLTVNGNDALIKTSTDVSYRDIGYTTWVTVNIPSQVYTGSELTPDITVTDNKSGSPNVLAEGTDYEVLMPEGGCVRPGDYTIIIKGKGNFAGQQKATFTVTSPAGTWAGSGTATDPYLILTLDDLTLLASKVNEGINYKDTHFKLMSDIDMDDEDFTPIGGQDRPFQGTFDGLYFTISNFNITYFSYSGVFGYIGQYGTVKNLRVAQCHISTDESYAGVIAARNDGTISSCESIESRISTLGSGQLKYFGGIAGYMGSGSISYCTNGTEVIGGFFAEYIGGIVGYNESGEIETCFNTKNGGGNSNIGGIAGYNGGNVMGCINQSILGGLTTCGGIVGTNANGGTVEHCLSLKSLSHPLQVTYFGSIIGKNLGTAINNYYNFDNDNDDDGDKTLGGINGSDVTRLSQKALARFRGEQIGFVFQFHQLLPEFTALENIMMPALIAGRSHREARRRAEELLAFMNLSDRADHKPAELSGGEKQRIAVARALVNKPAVVLADEPSGSLDSANKAELHSLFFDLRDSLGQTFVIVTHDEGLAAQTDRTIHLRDGLVVSPSAGVPSPEPLTSPLPEPEVPSLEDTDAPMPEPPATEPLPDLAPEPETPSPTDTAKTYLA